MKAKPKRRPIKTKVRAAIRWEDDASAFRQDVRTLVQEEVGQVTRALHARISAEVASQLKGETVVEAHFPGAPTPPSVGAMARIIDEELSAVADALARCSTTPAQRRVGDRLAAARRRLIYSLVNGDRI